MTWEFDTNILSCASSPIGLDTDGNDPSGIVSFSLNDITLTYADVPSVGDPWTCTIPVASIVFAGGKTLRNYSGTIISPP